MRLRSIVLAFAAATTLSIGIAQAVPGYAMPTARTAESQQFRPNDITTNIDVQAFSGCGEFNGNLSYYHSYTPQGEPYWYFVVRGGLYVHCAGGTAELNAYSKCDGVVDGLQIGNTTGTEAISVIPDSCDSPMSAMHVLLCYTSAAGGACAASQNI